MSKDGSVRDYSSGDKLAWRKQVWNLILRRTKGREKRHFVLYLPGPQDLDRKVARNRGVPDCNLFAVDWLEENIANVRSSGGYGVRASVIDALWSWPKSAPVCALFLDFCSGIESENTNILDCFQRECFSDSVVALNFMRGRDPFSNEIRDAVKRGFMPVLDPAFKQGPKGDINHRGIQFLMKHCLWFASLYVNGAHPVYGLDGIYWKGREAGEKTREMAWNLFYALRPRWLSYKSGSLTFDTILFQWMKVDHSLFSVADRKEVAGVEWKNLDESVRASISASLATRTRRKRLGRAIRALAAGGGAKATAA